MKPTPTSLYATYCRPKLSDLLASLDLNPVYARASGAYLYRDHPDGSGQQHVLDLVGGFGTGLFGHNNPELRELLKTRLDEDIPFMAQSAQREEAGRSRETYQSLAAGRSAVHLSSGQLGNRSGGGGAQARLQGALRSDPTRIEETARDIGGILPAHR